MLQCQRFQQFEGRILQRSLFRPKRVTKILEKRSEAAIVHFVDCSLVYRGRRDNRKRCFVDLRTLSMLARRFNPVVVTPLGNAALVRSSGLRRVEELDWWQEAKASALPIMLTPAQHFSARNPFDRNRALWGGFVLRARGARIYFAGDTAYGSFFRDVRLRLGSIDLALLPIGAYEPRWFMQSVHMNPAEAVQAHLELEPRESIAMHFGTFQLTTEGIDAPLRALEEARRASGLTA